MGAGTVLGFVADHVIAQHVAVVADTDPAGLGFPYVSVIVPEAVLYAGDWWDVFFFLALLLAVRQEGGGRYEEQEPEVHKAEHV